MRRLILAFVALAGGAALAADLNVNDPANEIVRVRARITTPARRVDLSLRTGTVVSAQARVLSGSASADTGVESRACHVENGSSRPIEIDCQWLLTNLPPDGSAEWTVSLEPAGDGVVEIYNANDDRRPRLVDRVANDISEVRFSTPARLLRDGGPIPIGSVGMPRVLAFYYPWYLHSTWVDDPLLKDHSPSRYSTDQQTDVNAEFAEARRAGLDGLVMSWVGVNRPFRLMIEAAHQTGMLVSTLLETDASREGGHKRNPVDPNIMQDWIAQIVDMYGSDRSFLTLGGRPVIFVYLAPLIDPPTWRTIMANIRASGRNPLIMAEATDAAWLDGLDGEFLYAPAGIPSDQLPQFDLTQSLRIRTYHLLPRASNARRIWAATVSPGYDDRQIPTRLPSLYRDRANGAYYDAQWQAALAARPDWVLVTSWNEWYENTQIETSELYDDMYVRRTAAWARRFRCQMNPPHPTTKPERLCDDDQLLR
jgi:glycoprotein endo-alpha-1,2-mannosidase